MYRPFTSRDLDLLASIANAYHLASETHATLQRPRRRTASPVLANVEVKTGVVLRVGSVLEISAWRYES